MAFWQCPWLQWLWWIWTSNQLTLKAGFAEFFRCLIHARPPYFTSLILICPDNSQVSLPRIKAIAFRDLSLRGSTVRVHLWTICPITHCSPAAGAYALHCSNRPVLIAFLRAFNSSSTADVSSASLLVIHSPTIICRNQKSLPFVDYRPVFQFCVNSCFVWRSFAACDWLCTTQLVNAYWVSLNSGR